MSEQQQEQGLDPWALVEDVLDHEPGTALAAISGLKSWLEEMENDTVLRARVEGWPWERIARSLGRSKQSVWEKHRDPDEMREPVG